jgi:tetratricopeptide (TPR) repeat protein
MSYGPDKERTLALFGKKATDTEAPDQPGGASAAPVVFSPEKATKFFEKARTVEETGQYQYAIQLWLDGLRWDPGSMVGLQAFFAVVPKFLNDPSSKKGVDRNIIKSVSGKGDVDKFLLAILEWALKPKEATLAVRAFEATAKLGMAEPSLWVGERAFATAATQPKPRKDLIMKCCESFARVGAFDKSIIAAEHAHRIDPSDGQLGAYIRTLAAQATMARGGYEQAGQAGGFRQNIRDADKQRMLEESERIVKTDETIDRLLVAAVEEYKKRPTDLPTIDKLGKLLMERGRPQDELKAHKLFMEAFEATKQFRFREQAGDIRIRQSRRGVSDLQQMLEKAPAGEKERLERMLADAQAAHANLELAEHQLRVDAYPTDLVRKFELGKRYFSAGKFNESIDIFQESQQDPKNRAPSLLYLGQAFINIQWFDEAIETFRRGLDIREISPEMNLEMRYWLMVALQHKGVEAQDLVFVEEADKIASSIAVQSISFRDIRARREALKKLLAELRAKQ